MVGVVCGMVSLTGCGADVLPLAGVRAGTDGAPYALLRPCGDDSYRGLALDGRPDDVGADGPVTTGWDVRRKSLSGDAEFPLFSPPDAWRARHRGAQRLVSGHTYSLAFGRYPDSDYTGTVTFTAKDIARLKPGRVWADGRAMSLGEFEELAEDSC